MLSQNRYYLAKPNFNVNKFIKNCLQSWKIQHGNEVHFIRSIYDTFDKRLKNHDVYLLSDSSKNVHTFNLSTCSGSEILCKYQSDSIPVFIQDIADSNMRNHLTPIIKMRALLPCWTHTCKQSTYNVVNADEKTVVRCCIEEYSSDNSSQTPKLTLIILKTIRGYQKEQIKFQDWLDQQPTVLYENKNDGDYFQSINKAPATLFKKDYALNVDQTVSQASKIIFSQLLHTMEINEQGMIDNIDTEFLHDFRVASRRTRSGITQIKGIIPPDKLDKLKSDFKWLCQISSPTRDLDVYLLKFDHYRHQLSPEIREHLLSLKDFLIKKQQQEHKILVKHVKSKQYQKLKLDWKKLIKRLPELSQQNSKIAIKIVADACIWKIYQKLLNDGQAIKFDSPAETLHELRKTGKKLRYLMEFFKTLYSESSMKKLLAVQKHLQDNLGDFQDFEVQASSLKGFCKQMQAESTISIETIMAIGVLVENLINHQNQVRQEFATVFKTFSAKSHQQLFRSLFEPKK